MERSEHLAGMLDRDQRTAKLRFFLNDSDKKVPRTYDFQEKNVNEASTNPNSIISCCPKRNKSSSSCSYLTWKKGYLLHSFQRLKNVLIVGVCLTLVTLPASNTLPTKMNSKMEEQPKWINPCGLSLDKVDFDHNTPTSMISDEELLNQIINQARIAINKANGFKERFANLTFNNRTFDEVHTVLFKDQGYDWLVKLPKSLGEATPQAHLEALKLQEALLDAYRYLQTVAVGLEQVAWDEQRRTGNFTAEFSEAEHLLRSVLCELQMTIIEHNIAMRPDVTRDIMTKDFREMNLTDSKARDFMIFRDYINALEYVLDVFTYMKMKI